MVLRLAGGDLNALTGLAGFAVGIWIGLFFLAQWIFSWKKHQTTVEQWLCVASRGSGPVVVIADGAGIHFL